MKVPLQLLLVSILCVPVFAQQNEGTSAPTKRLYIEEKVKTVAGTSVHCDNYGNCYGHNNTTTRNESLEATHMFMKSCPAVTVTDNREAADFVLRINGGSSTLFKQNGDVAYVSPAKFRVSNLVKDVCGYISSPH